MSFDEENIDEHRECRREIERLKDIIRAMRKDDLECELYDMICGDRPIITTQKAKVDYIKAWNADTESIIKGEMKP